VEPMEPSQPSELLRLTKDAGGYLFTTSLVIHYLDRTKPFKLLHLSRLLLVTASSQPCLQWRWLCFTCLSFVLVLYCIVWYHNIGSVMCFVVFVAALARGPLPFLALLLS